MAFDATAVVDRTELGLSPLVLSPETGYYIQRDGFGPGEVSFRQDYAQSPFVQGKTLVHSVKDHQTSVLIVRVEGESKTQLYQRMSDLAEAFEQFNYDLTVTLDGVDFSYECDAASYTVGSGGNMQDMWLRSNTQLMAFDIPHRPKVAGFR